MESDERVRARALLLAAGSILLPTLFILSQFPAALMLLDTTATGGDLASHNYTAAYLRHLLLTEHRLTGWIPGNYGGYALFQMYFPLPFAAIALTSLVLAPNVAFKLVTILGIATLPAAAYFLLRRLKTPFPGPALGSSLVLLFLFQDGNAMWGGNIASTLAGEFTYSMSLPIALLYLGFLPRLFDAHRTAVLAAVIVAVLALTHANAVLWVGLAGAIAIAPRPAFAASLLRLALVFVGAAALCAFWLVPAIWYAPWTTAYRHVWTINSIREVLPPVLWPVVAVAAAAPLLLVWRRADRGRAYWRGVWMLYAAFFAALLEYVVAPNFGVVDIRFLPFAQLMLCLLAAAGLGYVLSGLPAVALSIPIVFLGVALVVQAPAARMRQWITWNYEGFERKVQWPVYRQIADDLRGDIGDPRVVYEHSADNEALGTTRAFENLPLFAGRSTLEGVHLQASVTSPFIFYTQSEISQVMSCPFAEWGCSRTNLAAGIGHLKMMNVSDFIVRSDEVKALAADEPDLVPRATIGAYNLYHLARNSTGYVVAIRESPYAVVTNNWKETAYRWFKRAGPDDPMPVFVPDAASAAGAGFAGVFTALPDQVPHRALPAAALEEHMEAERISVAHCVPGQPLLIRVSYHPRWRSTTGERVWLAGPGFMLVFPVGDRLDLIYGETGATRAGTLITLVALLAAAFLWWRRDPPTTRAPVSSPSRRAVVGVLYGIGVVVVAAAGVRARTLDPDITYRAAQRFYDQGDRNEALAGFRRARDRAPLSNTAIHSSYYEAIILYQQKRWREAQQAFEYLAETYPEAQAAAEATYHVGLCAEELGDLAGARRWFTETEQRFPSTTWALQARERAATLRTNNQPR